MKEKAPMDEKPIPFRKTVFVCVNNREDGRVSCAGGGRDGEKICEALKHAVKDAGLKKQVRVARSGCLDLCEQGPNLFIYPEGRWRSGVTLEDVPKIVKTLGE
jgi:(2Fe-2S) ferredoxin